jgi:hypothetical protein
MRESPPGFGRAFNLHIESADLGEQKGTVVNFDPPLTPREVAQALNISAPAFTNFSRRASSTPSNSAEKLSFGHPRLSDFSRAFLAQHSSRFRLDQTAARARRLTQPPTMGRKTAH